MGEMSTISMTSSDLSITTDKLEIEMTIEITDDNPLFLDSEKFDCLVTSYTPTKGGRVITFVCKSKDGNAINGIIATVLTKRWAFIETDPPCDIARTSLALLDVPVEISAPNPVNEIRFTISLPQRDVVTVRPGPFFESAEVVTWRDDSGVDFWVGSLINFLTAAPPAGKTVEELRAQFAEYSPYVNKEENAVYARKGDNAYRFQLSDKDVPRKKITTWGGIKN
ncbi:hypothetical protein ACFL6S_12105 [Candidatus Poribacteria bacterium]